MNQKIRAFLQNTIFLRDIKCIVCGAELETESKYCICKSCFSKLPFINGKVCKSCGEPIKSLAQYCLHCKNHIGRGFDKARAVFFYEGEIAKLIKDIKFFGKQYIAEYLSIFLLNKYIEEGFDCDLVIPAPISKKSEKARGFNQSLLLCSAFKSIGLSVYADCLEKAIETQNQVGLNFKDRQTNLCGAFKVKNKNVIKGKNVLVVDDIYTTGATVGEIAETLKKSGANKVFVLSLCHEMLKSATN